MKNLLLCFGFGLLLVNASAQTPDELVEEALKNNPELRFYTAQIEALPKAAQIATPTIPFPLDFPSREKFRASVLNLDKELAELYLAEFRFALAGTVRLKAMEYQAATETATSATDLAARTGALVKMLEERPAAGVTAVIERRILEGAALPFIRTAAEQKVSTTLLRTELNGLLGRKPDTDLTVTNGLVMPTKASEVTTDALVMKIREAEIARGLAGLEAAFSVEGFQVGPWFTKSGLGANEPLSGLTLPSATGGSSPSDRRKRLQEDARAKLERELAIRKIALEAAREVGAAMPEKLIEDLKSASDLAERQYRVGALGVNILIEAHREYLGALEARNQAVSQAWRNSLDLELLQLPSKGGRTGKVIVNPAGQSNSNPTEQK